MKAFELVARHNKRWSAYTIAIEGISFYFQKLYNTAFKMPNYSFGNNYPRLRTTGLVDGASALETGLVPGRVKPTTIKLVFADLLFHVHNERDSVKPPRVL